MMTHQHSPKQILVAAATPASRQFQREILERAGFAVREAGNGMEALEHILRLPFDLVIAEVDMPSMDGFTLVQSIRKESVNTDVPVLLTVPEVLESHVKRSGQVGANLLLAHPMPAETMAEAVAMLTGLPLS